MDENFSTKKGSRVFGPFMKLSAKMRKFRPSFYVHFVIYLESKIKCRRWVTNFEIFISFKLSCLIFYYYIYIYYLYCRTIFTM